MMGSMRAVLVLALALPLLGGCGSSPIPGSIGVRARREETTGKIVVVDVPPGLAGAQAGLEPGDEIIAVEGVPVAEMSARAFSRAVRGDVGTKVMVTIKRGGALRNVEIQRMPLK
jgi:carboxyl-terminal processing protease